MSDVVRQTALVTGASSGIGRDLARLFARDGQDLVLVARDSVRLGELADELQRLHDVRAHVLVADLADPGAPAGIMRGLEERRIGLDYLVNNAGFGGSGPFAQRSISGELAMMQVNMVALTHLTRLVLPAMIARRRGRILNVASTAAFQPGPLMAVYYATKAYVLSFSEALASELRGSGVTVTALCPGPTRTGFQAEAKIEESRLVRGPLLMESAAVARAGYQGMMRGRTVVIPGLLNWLLAQAVRITPRRLVTAISRALIEKS
jgi:short-subunit dehydrogenase